MKLENILKRADFVYEYEIEKISNEDIIYKITYNNKLAKFLNTLKIPFNPDQKKVIPKHYLKKKFSIYFLMNIFLNLKKTVYLIILYHVIDGMKTFQVQKI